MHKYMFKFNASNIIILEDCISSMKMKASHLSQHKFYAGVAKWQYKHVFAYLGINVDSTELIVV